MKRIDFLKYLREYHCVVVDEGAKHMIIENKATGAFTTLPRHNELEFFLAKKICKQLGVPALKKR